MPEISCIFTSVFIQEISTIFLFFRNVPVTVTVISVMSGTGEANRGCWWGSGVQIQEGDLVRVWPSSRGGGEEGDLREKHNIPSVFSWLQGRIAWRRRNPLKDARSPGASPRSAKEEGGKEETKICVSQWYDTLKELRYIFVYSSLCFWEEWKSALDSLPGEYKLSIF